MRKVPQRPNLFELYWRAEVLPAWSERTGRATTRRMWTYQTVKDYGKLRRRRHLPYALSRATVWCTGRRMKSCHYIELICKVVACMQHNTKTCKGRAQSPIRR